MKAFLKAGILTEERELKDTDTGTPQGSILSPLLSNVALTVLDGCDSFRVSLRCDHAARAGAIDAVLPG